jgi:hypothetical protein
MELWLSIGQMSVFSGLFSLDRCRTLQSGCLPYSAIAMGRNLFMDRKHEFPMRSIDQLILNFVSLCAEHKLIVT